MLGLRNEPRDAHDHGVDKEEPRAAGGGREEVQERGGPSGPRGQDRGLRERQGKGVHCRAERHVEAGQVEDRGQDLIIDVVRCGYLGFFCFDFLIFLLLFFYLKL